MSGLTHTYLFKPGLWEISGLYYDKNETPHPQNGQALVTHSPGLWAIDCALKIVGADPQEVEARYEFEPFPQGARHAEWKSQSGGPEPVFGLFVLVDDAIMMPWQSRSNVYWGQEVLVHVSDEEYRGRGFAFLQNEKVSSWANTLRFAG